MAIVTRNMEMSGRDEYHTHVAYFDSLTGRGITSVGGFKFPHRHVIKDFKSTTHGGHNHNIVDSPVEHFLFNGNLYRVK